MAIAVAVGAGLSRTGARMPPTVTVGLTVLAIRPVPRTMTMSPGTTPYVASPIASTPVTAGTATATYLTRPVVTGAPVDEVSRSWPLVAPAGTRTTRRVA